MVSRAPLRTSIRDLLTLLKLGAVYWLRIYPQVGRELAGWERRASAIPDPILCGHAMEKLTGERLNPEAAAFFAVLAPRTQRRRLVRLIVAYQVLYDYLDAVNEQPDCTTLANGLQLHRALSEAVLADLPISDHYTRNPIRGDGGYVRALIDACRNVASVLPSIVSIGPVLARATERCAHAQSHNHAIIARNSDLSLIDWSLAQASSGTDSYLWWELAAGGISCLAIHALLALAASPHISIQDAGLLDAAYFPPICAISALLDSLADYHQDAGTTNHIFVSHYHDSSHAAERLTAIAQDASGRIEQLNQSRHHAVILAGIGSFYLSSPSVQDGFPRPAAESLIRCLGPIATPIRAAMRLRRHRHAKASAE